MTTSAQPGALLDALYDLQHDLGKHLRMPLAFLPVDAPPDQVREALQRALSNTRSSSAGTLSAREIWRRFVDGLSAEERTVPPFNKLRQAVERALAWEERLQGARPLDRAAAQRDLDAVGGAIRAFIDTVEERLG